MSKLQSITANDAAGAAAEGESCQPKSISLKVHPDFKKDFKGFAVAQGMSMTDLLKEGFELSKKKRRK